MPQPRSFQIFLGQNALADQNEVAFTVPEGMTVRFGSAAISNRHTQTQTIRQLVRRAGGTAITWWQKDMVTLESAFLAVNMVLTPGQSLLIRAQIAVTGVFWYSGFIYEGFVDLPATLPAVSELG